MKPGESTTLATQFSMHAGMDGKHLFDVTLLTNDPNQLQKHFYIASDWVAPGTQ